MKLPSKQGLLSMRGISARNTDKKQVLLWSCLQNKDCFQWERYQPKTQTNKQTKTITVSVHLQLPPVESRCHGQDHRRWSTRETWWCSSRCRPVRQDWAWPVRQDWFLTCVPVGDHTKSDSLTGNCLISNRMVWVNIVNLQRQMRIKLQNKDDWRNMTMF